MFNEHLSGILKRLEPRTESIDVSEIARAPFGLDMHLSTSTRFLALRQILAGRKLPGLKQLLRLEKARFWRNGYIGKLIG